MTLFAYILFVFAANILEAEIEILHGDKKHWKSAAIQLVGICLWLLAGVPIWFAIAAFVAVRVWFDIYMNHRKKLPWHYLGSTKKPKNQQAFTDRILNGLNKYYVLAIRAIICTACITFLIVKTL